MKRWIKRIGIILLIPIILLVLISISLYIPPLQNYVVGKATEYASKSTGMDISIGKIRLSFPLNLIVADVKVVSPPADTLLLVNKISVSVKLLPLLRSRAEVDAVDIENASVNSGSILKGIAINGLVGKLHLKADYVDLANEQAILNEVTIANSRLTLCLNDTTQTPDTASAPVNWKFLLQSLQLEKVSFELQMPADSLRLATFINKGELKGGTADLLKQRYTVGALTIAGSSVSYNSGDTTNITAGLDPSHLYLTNLDIALDSVTNQRIETGATIRNLSFTERSGINVTSLKGKVQIDSTQLKVNNLTLNTPYSEISISAQADMAAFGKNPSGQSGALLDASIGKQDIFFLIGNLPPDFQKAYPDKPLTLQAIADGNMGNLHLRKLNAELSGAFQLNATGQGEALADSTRRSGEINLKGETGNLSFVLAMMDSASRKRFTIPRHIRLQGKAAMASGVYSTKFTVSEGTGKIDLTARYDTRKINYAADLIADSMQLRHFMPKDSIDLLTASVHVKGQGMDFFSPSTSVSLQGNLNTLQYGNIPLSDIKLDASLLKNKAKLVVNSSFEPLRVYINLDGSIQKKKIDGVLTVDAGNIDLKKLNLSDKAIASSFLFTLGAETDLKKMYRAGGKLNNWKIITPQKTDTLKDIVFTAQTNTDTTTLNVRAGDLLIKLAGDNNAEGLGKQFSDFSSLLKKQLEKEALNLELLRPLLPVLQMTVTAGKDNPLYNYLALLNIGFDKLSLKVNTTPEDGLNGNANIYKLNIDTLQLDVIRFMMRQDTVGVHLDGEIINNPGNKQHVFETGMEGLVTNRSAQLLTRFTDGSGETGLYLGVRAEKAVNGFTVHFYPDDPIIAFRQFRLNPDNAIRIEKDKNIGANLRLEGEDGTALILTSKPDSGKLETLELDIRKINLALISKLSPYSPNIGGLLNAGIQYNRQDSTFFVASEIGIDSLSYEHNPIGDLSLYANYLPGSGKSHQLDARLQHNKKEVVSARGAYYQLTERDSLAGKVDISSFPLSIANAFIPGGMASVAGALKGEVSVNGKMSAPEINGHLNLDTASVFVAMAGTRFKFDDKRIEIENNLLKFNQFGITTSGKNPFVIDGSINASDPVKMIANLRLSADEMELLNVKQNKESLVYGKVYVDINSTVKGPLDALSMRGNIQLLGNTDLTYVLKDSPLTVQDRLADLVTFVDFADTTQVKKDEAPPLQLGGLDMLMTIQIDQAVRLKVDLSEDRESRIELEGGGDLSFQYTPQGDMVLTGRYTLSGGIIKYALPVIPLKTFNIENGSYVQWSGNAMDPTLNITATERVRTSVALGDQQPRMVNFDVSIIVKNQLENLSLAFNLAAPEDMAVQNDLSAMSDEERNKQAVSMLVTNMYLAGKSTGKMNVNMGNALNSFLQSEINNLAGSALKGVDVSVGIENVDQNGDGNKQTDYSFQFSKRFYNDRIRIIIGGRISTGAPEEQNQSFIDNISLEYRLDGSGTRYVRLFHDKNYESILEGEITETGVGIVLRKKMRRLGELFIFKKKKKQVIQEVRQ